MSQRLKLMICLFAAVTALGSWVYQRECTFQTSKITSDLGYHPEWDVSHVHPDKLPAIKELLKQPFRYLGCGAQCYVFASDDGEYVLKLFKHHHLNTKSWLDKIPLPGVQLLAEKRSMRHAERRQRLFYSCKIAYSDIPDETGLVFAQLNKGSPDLDVQVDICDRYGKWHSIDLKEQEFLLQRRARRITHAIDQWMEKGDIAKAMKGIDQTLGLLSRRCDKGIRDLDAAFNQNYGLTSVGAIQLDVGCLDRYELLRERPYRDQEILRLTSQFRTWLIHQHPRLLPHFEASLFNVLDRHSCLPTPAPKPLEQYQMKPGSC